MWTIIQKLIWGHICSYKILCTDIIKGPNKKLLRKYTLQCKECGNIKTKVAK